MTTKTSAELKAELTNLFYGIDPNTLLVDSVTVSRGGTLTLRRAGRSPSVYRIKGGKPAYGEIVRVFGLTDLIALSPASHASAGVAVHPAVAGLQMIAAEQRRMRDADRIAAGV